ncbi:MAG: hypothetical protein HW412_1880 [Bacteroidetes bacterium]|nr:hypothetical protein [Bacteroidota bacterium]
MHVRKVGAFPLLTLDSDRMTRRMFKDVPEAYDTQSPELALKLANIATAMISVDNNETPGLLSDIPPERFAARGKTFQAVSDMIMKRNVKQVNLGNGLYPTAALAAQFGIPQHELADMFWSGVDVDYTKLQATGDAVMKAFTSGKEVHITNPNGTNIKFRIEGRHVFVSDGVISADDIKRGGAACQVWLPAGEVYLAVVPGTAEGKVVEDRNFYQGKEILGLTVTFKAGKVTSMTAKSGLEPLKALYDAATGPKDQLAFVDVGINPNVRLIPDSRMVSWVPSGNVAVGIGNNTWAGGDNAATFSWTNFLPGSTLKVDGKAIVENGRLLIGRELEEIANTTTSQEALKHFKAGRDLSDRLRNEEAVPHFEKAIAADPNFAMAYYELATASSSNQAFLDNLGKATALADKVSEGERLTIMLLQAGSVGNVTRQEDLVQQLMMKYPNDPRAHQLAGGFYAGQRNYSTAIGHLKRATEIDPSFHPAYNSLGYAYSNAGNYPQAEKAFKKYTELLPTEPNPQDSYAELLMKEGKFDESIKAYERALSLNPKFYGSYVGLGMNYVLKGKPEEGRKKLQKMYDLAPNDGIRLQALFATQLSYVDEGKWDKAIEENKKSLAIVQKNNDAPGIAEALARQGDYLLEAGKLGDARASYKKAFDAIENSTLSMEFKDNARQAHLISEVETAVRMKDFAAAKTHANEYTKNAEANHHPIQMQTAHQLAGTIALNEQNYAAALRELKMANERNPRNLYRLGEAYAGLGDREKAKEAWTRAANFNEINYSLAFVRTKARQQ